MINSENALWDQGRSLINALESYGVDASMPELELLQHRDMVLDRASKELR